MLLVDIILLLIILGFIGAGAKDGFVHTIGRLIGAVVGFAVARAYYVQFSVIMSWLVPTGWARLVSFILIFVFITRLAGYVLKLVDGAFSILKILPFLKSIDKLLGGIVGLFEGIVLLGGIIYLVNILKVLPTVANWIHGSKVAPYIQSAFISLMAFLL